MFGGESRADSLRLGAVFDLSGSESATGLTQVRSSELAIVELNRAGGVALRDENKRRPVTLIICDGAADLDEAVRTLIDEHDVKAIIGPAWGESFAALASAFALPNDVLLLGPSALSDAAKSGRDSDLSWGMQLSEADRVPMLRAQLRAIEAQLGAAGESLAVALVMRAAGPTTSVRLSRALIEPDYRGGAGDRRFAVTTYQYTDGAGGLSSIVGKLMQDQPDVIIADGASEVATDLVGPLEGALSEHAKRPYYLLSEAAQVPQLLTLAAAAPTLQARLSVIGAVPTEAARPVYAEFERAYLKRYAESPHAITGAAASYAAVYALAFGAIAADEPLYSGDVIARGLRQLSAGDLSLTTTPSDIAGVLQALGIHAALSVTGPLGDLSWNMQGSPRHALVGVYCARLEDERFSFVSTGYTYDIATGALSGTAVPCAVSSGNAQLPTQPPAADGGGPAEATDAGAALPPSAAAPAAMTSPAVSADAGIAMPVQRVATDIGLAVQYSAFNTQPFDGVIEPGIKIINRNADEPIPLCSLSARYYFTNEHAESCPHNCATDAYYTGFQPSGATTVARRSYHPAGPNSSSAYLELTFPCTGRMLELGESVEAQQQFHTEPYQNFDESDDYSFIGFPTGYVDWDRVTLHRDGVLVWGRPPEL